MLYEYLRLFKYDGATFTDLSLDNQDDGTTIPLALTTTDFLYIFQYFPINNFYMNMNVVNAQAAGMKVEYYTGANSASGWSEVADLLDATQSSGAPLAKNGLIQFEPDRDNRWAQIPDTSDENEAPELQALTLYNTYPLRVSFDTNLDAGTILQELSYAFTTSQQLNSLDVEIDSYLESFASGKTNWEKEIITCSKIVLMDMKVRSKVINRGQILRMDDVSLSTDWRTLELIYMNLGASYKDNRLDARTQYLDLLASRNMTRDSDNDAQVDRREINNDIRDMSR